MPILGPTLLRRFESREGYRSFDDVIPARESEELHQIGSE